MDLADAKEIIDRVFNELNKAIIGKYDVLQITLATIVSGGHVLFEGPPGTAKTFIVKSIAKVFGGIFKRIQGNPDLLPTDLTGYYIHRLDGTRYFVEGPIFANFLMFDELNRTPPRVQSALLEALAENQVSIEGETHNLKQPFHVFATEVPIDIEIGVYPLTITLRDRFWVRIHIGYNVIGEEYEIVKNSDKLYLVKTDIEQVSSVNDLLEIRKVIDEKIYVSDKVVKYIVDLVNYIRGNKHVSIGPSHRAGIYLYRVAKALALMDKRDYVIPDDVKKAAPYVLPHRIVVSRESELQGVKPEDIVREALKMVEVPKE